MDNVERVMGFSISDPDPQRAALSRASHFVWRAHSGSVVRRSLFGQWATQNHLQWGGYKLQMNAPGDGEMVWVEGNSSAAAHHAIGHLRKLGLVLDTGKKLIFPRYPETDDEWASLALAKRLEGK